MLDTGVHDADSARLVVWTHRSSPWVTIRVAGTTTSTGDTLDPAKQSNEIVDEDVYSP